MLSFVGNQYFPLISNLGRLGNDDCQMCPICDFYLKTLSIRWGRNLWKGGNGMRLIEGVELLDQLVHTDRRGDLMAFEQFTNLPFALERVFFMKVDAPDTVRGGHANSCDEFIVALAGSVLIEVDNGHEQSGVCLRSYDQALWIKPGVLIHLREFAPATLLLVCASARYEDTRHFDRAQPHLMKVDCFA